MEDEFVLFLEFEELELHSPFFPQPILFALLSFAGLLFHFFLIVFADCTHLFVIFSLKVGKEVFVFVFLFEIALLEGEYFLLHKGAFAFVHLFDFGDVSDLALFQLVELHFCVFLLFYFGGGEVQHVFVQLGDLFAELGLELLDGGFVVVFLLLEFDLGGGLEHVEVALHQLDLLVELHDLVFLDHHQLVV